MKNEARGNGRRGSERIKDKDRQEKGDGARTGRKRKGLGCVAGEIQEQ